MPSETGTTTPLPVLNEFSCLYRRLARERQALDEDAGGGGSPTEGIRERIADLENEIDRRENASTRALYALGNQE